MNDYTYRVICVVSYIEDFAVPHALNIRDIGEGLNTALDARAAEEGISKSELVRSLLAKAVQPPKRRLGAGQEFVDTELRTVIDKMQDHPGSESAWQGISEPGLDPLAEGRNR